MAIFKKKEVKVAENTQRAFLQMYQAGYIDGAGWRRDRISKKRMEEVAEAFKKRFFKKDGKRKPSK